MIKDLPLNEKVHILPCYPHVIAIQKQRKFKDLFLIKDIYDHCRNQKSNFEPFFFKESLFAYERRIKKVFANCWLDPDYFPEVEFISSIEQFDGLRDGLCFIHDIESIFNSRNSLTDKEMNILVDVVNNLGKHRVQLRASAHRELSVDVKVRSLVNLWIEPEPYISGSYWYLNNYVVVVTVYDSYMKKIGCLPVNDLNRYCNLYDTLEEAKKIEKVKVSSWM